MLVSFLRRLLGQKQDPLLERAGNLVQAAQVSAVGMFTPLLDSFPILRQVDIQHWDFILTVVGVFVASRTAKGCLKASLIGLPRQDMSHVWWLQTP